MDKEQEKRRYCRWIQQLSLEKFWNEQNRMHSRAYFLAEKHYDEAMDIVLQPKQKQKVLDKVKEIRESWDGIGEVYVEKTVGQTSPY